MTRPPVEIQKEEAFIRGQKSLDERLCSIARILLRLTAICQPVFAYFEALLYGRSLRY